MGYVSSNPKENRDGKSLEVILMNLIEELSKRIENAMIEQAKMKENIKDNKENTPEWKYLEGKVKAYFEAIDLIREKIG